MKKVRFFLLAFLLNLATLSVFADYGILINDKKIVVAESTGSETINGKTYDQYLAKVKLAQNDVVKLVNTEGCATWMVALDPYGEYQKFTAGTGSITCTAAGNYDFYIKLLYGEDLLYIGPGSDGATEGVDFECGSNPGDGCQDGPYGIQVNDTLTYAADPTGEADTEGRTQYMASVKLQKGDVVKLVNRSCDATWMVDLDPYGEYEKFTGGASTGFLTCNADGCYDFYIKLKAGDDILYIGPGSNCGEPVKPGDPITERPSYPKSVPEKCPDVMLQAFYYDSYESGAPGDVVISGTTKLGDTKWSTLLAKSSEIGMYFDLVWLPPSGKSEGGTGYHQTQYSNQNSAWGSKVELVEFINRMHDNNTKVIADIVINHAGCKSTWCDFYTQYFSPYGTFEPQASWICKTDEAKGDPKAGECASSITGTDDGGYNGQDNYPSARDWAHANTNVQAMMKAYLKWMKNAIGYDGWRYDYAQGFKGKYINMYNSASANYFSVSEFWNGDVANVKSYLADCGWNTLVFDFSNKLAGIQGIADGKYDMCVNSGLSGTGDGRYAVTFVDSHDTYFGCKSGRDNQDEIGGCGKSMESYNKDRVLAANAYILARPGVPCVFWPHWVKYQNEIKKMIMARHLTGVHSESVISDESAGDGFYKATIIGTKGSIRLLLGPNSGYATAPSGYKLAYKGGNFAMYYQTSAAEVPCLTITPSQKFKTATFNVEMKADALSGTPTIYYTTDGTEPTTASNKYTSAITIDKTTTVKAIAVLGTASSAVMEATYTYKEPQTTPIVLRFAHDDTWTGSVSVHIWDVKGGTINTGSWPGKALTLGTDGWYFFTCPEGVTSLKFVINNGGKGLQTGNLETDCDVCYKWKNGCEELDEDCGAIDVPFSVNLNPESSVFRNNAEGINVTITAVGDPEGSEPVIYYTTDGTNPTTSSAKAPTNPYTLNFKKTTELRAMAVAGNAKTEVATAVYTYKAPQTTPFTVKFYNTASWKKVNIYTWSTSDAAVNYTGAWPGTEIKDDNGDGWFEYTFSEVLPSVWVIFNNGASQTQDIFIDEDACYVWVKDKQAAYSPTCNPNDTPVEEITQDTEVPALDLNQPMYNVLGMKVNKNYRGIVIQNGHKYLLLD